MTVLLEPEEAANIIAGVVREIIANHGEALTLISAAQACGMLDVTAKSLMDLDLPKVDLMNNGRLIRYRLSDIRALIEERTIKAIPRRRGHH